MSFKAFKNLLGLLLAAAAFALASVAQGYVQIPEILPYLIFPSGIFAGTGIAILAFTALTR